VRWEQSAEEPLHVTPGLLSAVCSLVTDFDKPLAAFRQQLKHPLAPREAVFLVRCRAIGRVGDEVVLEDAAGKRLVAADRFHPSVPNLVRAAGMLSQPAVLLRLFAQGNRIVAQPLAALTVEHHLRLGV
jgi:hypothetical protein